MTYNDMQTIIERIDFSKIIKNVGIYEFGVKASHSIGISYEDIEGEEISSRKAQEEP